MLQMTPSLILNQGKRACPISSPFELDRDLVGVLVPRGRAFAVAECGRSSAPLPRGPYQP